jgi:hypothetical protein
MNIFVVFQFFCKYLNIIFLLQEMLNNETKYSNGEF